MILLRAGAIQGLESIYQRQQRRREEIQPLTIQDSEFSGDILFETLFAYPA